LSKVNHSHGNNLHARDVIIVLMISADPQIYIDTDTENTK